MIIDGRAIADDIYSALKERGSRLPHPPKLGILVGKSDPVIESFVRIKMKAADALGVSIIGEDMAEGATNADVIAAVARLCERTDGVIVQLPLPREFDTETILAAIANDRDVDAINPSIVVANKLTVAPVALAVLEILARASIDPKGKRAVVIGAGRLVGAPSAALLASHGAQVSMVTLESGSLDDLKDADIVVSGAGQPGLITPEMLKAGVALIDAGTSESAGKVVGDCDPACAEKASVYTPVPGGVGPIAVAMIFKNLFDLIEQRNARS